VEQGKKPRERMSKIGEGGRLHGRRRKKHRKPTSNSGVLEGEPALQKRKLKMGSNEKDELLNQL